MHRNKKTKLEILKEVFGYNAFRGKQEEIIETVCQGKDSLVIMPTGGGKSLCYQIPALMREGVALVISPLIALMNDQVTALQQLNVSAATLHSNIPYDEANEIFDKIEKGLLDLVYVSPEKVLSDNFLGFIKRQSIALIAIDEAHCVSVWGNDFRPEYVRLKILKDTFPAVPVIALTATADTATQTDISTQLGLVNEQKFLSSFERNNIVTRAAAGIKRAEQIERFLRDHENEAGIIYCLSRKSTEQIASRLQQKGYKAKAYHAGLESKVRREVQEDFQNDKIQIVCATIAFGMGIDKPNIRYVIHYNMPKNIEAYYQEIGRGGRDGEPAESLLFYSWADFLNLKRFIDESEAEETFKVVQRAKLDRMWEFASALSCRTNLILNYFGEYRNVACDHCDNCENPPQLFDGTTYAQMVLSGIVRTRETVGIGILMDILRGSYKQELKVNNYHELKTFGVGREVPYLHWRAYITQLINQGIVSIDYTNRSVLKTTPLSKAVLKGEVKVELSKYVDPSAKKKVVIKKATIDVSGMDENLFERLREWRRELAISQKVPPYVILHDKSLKQIAVVKPTDSNKLLSIDGIGQAKLDKYGDQIISLINDNAK